MNVLKIALMACSLSAVVAHAQTAPAAPEEQVAQANSQRADDLAAHGRVAAPKVKAEECVGPVSFCNCHVTPPSEDEISQITPWTLPEYKMCICAFCIWSVNATVAGANPAGGALAKTPLVPVSCCGA